MAKLSQTFKLEGGSNTAPVSNTVPTLNSQKLSQTFKIGSYEIPHTNDPVIPVLRQTEPTAPVETTASTPTVTPKLTSPVKTGSSPFTLLGIGGNSILRQSAEKANAKRGAEQTRAKELEAFDKADTSNVIYSSPTTKVTQNKLNMWLDPSYEMSDTEKKQAKEYYNAKMKEVRKRGLENMWTGKNGYSSPEEEQNLWLLGTKTSKAKQFGYGFFNELPLAKWGQNAVAGYVDKLTGTDDASKYLNTVNKSFEDTGSYKAGKAVSKISQYYTLNQSGLLEPLNKAISGWFTPRLSTALASGAYNLGMSETAINTALALGEKLGASFGNILSDEVADIVLDTLPEMAQNIRDGMSANEVKKEVLKNLGINMAYNLGGEAIPSVVTAVKNKLKCSQEAAETIVKNADEISDAVAKETTGEAPKIKVEEPKVLPEVKPVAKQTDEVAKSVAPSVDLTAQTVKQTNTPIEELKPVSSNKILGDNSFGETIASLRRSFDGKVKYLKDSDNEYAKSFKEALNNFATKPTKNTYNKAIKALDDYVDNARTAMKKNWSGEWYKKTFDDKSIRSSLEELGEKYGLKATALPEVKPKNEVMAEDAGLDRRANALLNEDAEKAQHYSSENKRVNDFLNGRNSGSIQMENGQIIERYSQKDMRNVLNDFKDNGFVPEDNQIAIRYNDGTIKVYGEGASLDDLNLRNVSGIIWGNESTTAYAGKGIKIENYDELNKNWGGDDWRVNFTTKKDVSNLIMAEDTGLNKHTKDLVEDVEEAVDNTKALNEPNVIKASGYAQPAEDATKVTAEYNERGMSKHIVGEETPMKVKDVSDEVKKMFKDEPDAYQVLKNKDTKALADEVYKSGDKPIQIGEKVYTGNAETKFRSMLADKNPAALPLGHQLAKDYSKVGNHEMAALVYRDMGKALTEAGQFTQASIINMMKNDPLTALQYAQKQLDELNKEGAKRFGDKWKNFSLTDDEIKAFNNIAPGNEEAIKALYDQIGSRLAKDYPTTLMEKLLEARKVSMLFNVRTNVRNFGANIPTLGLRWMSDRVDALGQNIAHLINPNFKVTQSITGSGINGRKLAKEVFESPRVQNLLNADVGKYELPSIKNSLMKDRQMFKGTHVEKWINKMTNGGIEKVNEKLFGKRGVESLAETVRNATYKALDLGDQPFIKENFIERLGSYIKAQGIKNINDVPEEAIQTAWEEAMKATYKDESWAVKMLRGIKGGIEKVPGAGKPLSQAAIPFLQAPGNIAARMVDYSPINATKGIGQILYGAVKKDADAVRKGIKSASEGLTGSGLILLGMALKGEGIITGNYADDKDEKNFQKANGFKPWALHVGDKYFTYDWAQPFAQNLMVGTLIQEAIENSDKEDSSVLKAIGYEGPKAAINSWFGSSPLQGLADLMKSNSYSGETDIAQNVIDSATSDFAGAFIPSLVNAIAKTNDTTQRNYYDPSSKLNTFVNQQMAKIPGLSKNLPAKYDTWGREIQYADGTGEAFAQRFLVPGDYGEESYDRINNEINRLYEATSNAAVFPQTAPNKVGDKTLNNKEVSEYQQDMGRRNRLLASGIINSKFYSSLDDDSKAEVLKQIYGASKLITERDLFNKPISDNSSYKELIKAYDNGKGTVTAVIKYFEAKAEKKKEQEEKTKNKK